MTYLNEKERVCNEICTVLQAVEEENVQKMAEMIISAEKVFVIGVGRVFIMLKAFVKRLNHLGIPAYYVGAVDEPAITSKDVLIVGSGSGESVIPVTIVQKAKKFEPRIIHIGSNMNSSISRQSDLLVRIPCSTKLNLTDELTSIQPMSSLFEQCLLILLDITALLIIEMKGINLEKLWHVHANLE